MPLDPHLADRVRSIPAGLDGDADRASPEYARAAAEFFTDPTPYVPPATVVVRSESIPGPHGPIPLRIYRAEPGPAPGSGAALLWVHGGGFRGGDLDMNESHVTSLEIAARSGVAVVSVDYRLAKDGVRFPVPLDDVEAAWRWLIAHADALGADSRRLSLGGGSAGANLATATALRVRESGDIPPALLLLAYPALHFPVPALDDDVHAVMATLPRALRVKATRVAEMFANYVGRISDLPVQATPGHASLDGFPPTRILLSEFDDFRPSGELFAMQLAEAGVPVKTRLAAGMLHGHLNRTPTLPEVSHSLDFFAEALAT